jgi:hypothetical protein
MLEAHSPSSESFASLSLPQSGRQVTWRCDNAHIAAHEIGRQFRHAINVAICPTVFDGNVLTDDVTTLLQNLRGTQPVALQTPRRDHEQPTDPIVGSAYRSVAGKSLGRPESF